MWTKILDIAKTATSMLQSGKVPPNTPKHLEQDMSKINFLASKKFFVVFCSIIILSVFYGISIFVLFLTAPVPNITIPFVTIFTETVKILAVIIASYLGVQTVLDFKYNTNTETSNNYSREEVDIKEITVIETNQKEDDYEIN